MAQQRGRDGVSRRAAAPCPACCIPRRHARHPACPSARACPPSPPRRVRPAPAPAPVPASLALPGRVRPSHHGPRPHPTRRDPFQRDPADPPPLLHPWIRRPRAWAPARVPQTRSFMSAIAASFSFARRRASRKKAREILPRFCRASPNSAAIPRTPSPDSAAVRPVSATVPPPQTFGRVHRRSAARLPRFCRYSAPVGEYALLYPPASPAKAASRTARTAEGRPKKARPPIPGKH